METDGEEMSQTVKEAILATEMKNVVARLDTIDLKLDAQNKHFDFQFNKIGENYATQQQFLDLKNELEAFKKSVRVNYLLIVIITALITALIYAQVGGHKLL